MSKSPEYQDLHPLLCTQLRMTWFLLEISDENLGVRDSEKCLVAECTIHGLVSLEAWGQLGRKSPGPSSMG